MNKDIKISHIQLRGLIVSTIIGVGILNMQNIIAIDMEQNGWIAIIISGLLTIPSILMINKIFDMYPGKDFFEVGKAIYGPVFILIKIIAFVYYLLVLAYVSRTLAELVKIFILRNTPLQIILITFLLSCTYLASHEIDVIARAGYFVYPMIIIFSLLIILIALPGAHWEHLLPLFRIDMGSLVKGVKDGVFNFLGFEIIIFVLPFIENKKNILKSELYAISTITAIYVIVFVLTVANFSLNQIKIINYPALVLTRKLDLPGYFLENVDGLFMALWVIIIFATIIPNFYGASKILSNIFKTKHHKYFVLPLVPVIYYIALKPANFISLMGTLGKYVNIGGLVFAFVLPILTLIIASIRKKVGK